MQLTHARARDRENLGEELYAEWKELSRAWQRGLVGVDHYYAQSMAYLGGDAGPLMDLAAFMPVRPAASALLRAPCVSARERKSEDVTSLLPVS